MGGPHQPLGTCLSKKGVPRPGYVSGTDGVLLDSVCPEIPSFIALVTPDKGTRGRLPNMRGLPRVSVVHTRGD